MKTEHELTQANTAAAVALLMSEAALMGITITDEQARTQIGPMLDEAHESIWRITNPEIGAVARLDFDAFVKHMTPTQLQGDCTDLVNDQDCLERGMSRPCVHCRCFAHLAIEYAKQHRHPVESAR